MNKEELESMGKELSALVKVLTSTYRQQGWSTRVWGTREDGAEDRTPGCVLQATRGTSELLITLDGDGGYLQSTWNANAMSALPAWERELLTQMEDLAVYAFWTGRTAGGS